jgi:hypothetical protein
MITAAKLARLLDEKYIPKSTGNNRISKHDACKIFRRECFVSNLDRIECGC